MAAPTSATAVRRKFTRWASSSVFRPFSVTMIGTLTISWAWRITAPIAQGQISSPAGLTTAPSAGGTGPSGPRTVRL